MNNLLEVKNLTTRFHTQDCIVHAVNNISFNVKEGEMLGIVGESGCGKSVTMLSIMRLIPQPPGKIESGEVYFEGRDLFKISGEEMRLLRGQDIAMIFQDPMTSLNPVLTIGLQITEALRTSHADDRSAGKSAGCRTAGIGGYLTGGGTPAQLPTPVFRGHAPTGDDRYGVSLRTQIVDRR